MQPKNPEMSMNKGMRKLCNQSMNAGTGPEPNHGPACQATPKSMAAALNPSRE
jgi:hypothetical protein